MLADKTVPSLEISVETKEGVVTLSGKVKTEAEATAAVELAAATEGVKKVDASGLKMADGRAGHQALADAIITGEVKGALIREKLSGDESDTGSRVKVETKEGVVYLSGTLKSAEKEKHAIKLARAIQGVKAVEATITIKSGE
jgi:hyperosmotically inducible protein